MSRFEGTFDAAGEFSGEGRKAAIACYLAGGDGWREAAQALGHAFASCAQVAAGTPTVGPEDKQSINQRVSEYLQRGPVKPDAIDND